jgi:hypothetical protein
MALLILRPWTQTLISIRKIISKLSMNHRTHRRNQWLTMTTRTLKRTLQLIRRNKNLFLKRAAIRVIIVPPSRVRRSYKKQKHPQSAKHRQQGSSISSSSCKKIQERNQSSPRVRLPCRSRVGSAI